MPHRRRLAAGSIPTDMNDPHSQGKACRGNANLRGDWKRVAWEPAKKGS